MLPLIFSGSEGLLKLWTIKTNECVKTFDQHLDKVGPFRFGMCCLHASRI